MVSVLSGFGWSTFLSITAKIQYQTLTRFHYGCNRYNLHEDTRNFMIPLVCFRKLNSSSSSSQNVSLASIIIDDFHLEIKNKFTTSITKQKKIPLQDFWLKLNATLCQEILVLMSPWFTHSCLDFIVKSIINILVKCYSKEKKSLSYFLGKEFTREL